MPNQSKPLKVDLTPRIWGLIPHSFQPSVFSKTRSVFNLFFLLQRSDFWKESSRSRNQRNAVGLLAVGGAKEPMIEKLMGAMPMPHQTQIARFSLFLLRGNKGTRQKSRSYEGYLQHHPCFLGYDVNPDWKRKHWSIGCKTPAVLRHKHILCCFPTIPLGFSFFGSFHFTHSVSAIFRLDG